MKKFDQIWIGIVVGLIAPIIVLYVIFQLGNFMSNITDFEAFMVNFKYTVILFKPSLLVNLAIFLLFVNRNLLKFSRGMVFSTMAYVLLVVSTYFF